MRLLTFLNTVLSVRALAFQDAMVVRRTGVKRAGLASTVHEVLILPLREAHVEVMEYARSTYGTNFNKNIDSLVSGRGLRSVSRQCSLAWAFVNALPFYQKTAVFMAALALALKGPLGALLDFVLSTSLSGLRWFRGAAVKSSEPVSVGIGDELKSPQMPGNGASGPPPFLSQPGNGLAQGSNEFPLASKCRDTLQDM